MTTIVLFGGPSDERHVSVASAQNVVRTLGNPLAWFWAPDGPVHDVAADDLLSHQRPFEIDFLPRRPALWPNLEQALDTLPVEDPVFVLAVHGGPGEDGTVQKMMEQHGIAFTGSGSAASAAAFDKGRAKEMLKGRVRMAESRTVSDPKKLQATVRDMLSRYERVVAKPLAGGSSRGLFFIDKGEDFTTEVDIPYIVEEFLTGRELTVGVIDRNGTPFALPVLEVEVDTGRSFDYAGKYLGSGTREICPAKIPDRMRDAAQKVANTAHTTLGCEGYSRTDVVATDDEMYFLELNTLPGLTTSSLVPKELQTAGIDFREFLESQIELARVRANVLSNPR
ncbi:MAG: ATP-grasp domain-containing protein [Acidobacteriota bacterium]|nr:ATP-grasp domain-containing protein [Acidobacteriota bacterium]